MAGLRHSLLFTVGMFGLKHKRVIVASLIREKGRAAGVANIEITLKTAILSSNPQPIGKSNPISHFLNIKWF